MFKTQISQWTIHIFWFDYNRRQNSCLLGLHSVVRSFPWGFVQMLLCVVLIFLIYDYLFKNSINYACSNASCCQIIIDLSTKYSTRSILRKMKFLIFYYNFIYSIFIAHGFITPIKSCLPFKQSYIKSDRNALFTISNIVHKWKLCN